MLRPPQFEAFVEPARDGNEIFRLILSLIIGMVIYVLLATLIVLGLLFTPGYLGQEGTHPSMALTLIETAETPDLMAVLLATFIPMALAAMLMALIHKRRPATLFGPSERFWRNFCLAAGVIAGMNLAFFLVEAILGGPLGYSSNLPLTEWLGYLPWAIPLLFVQTTSEEMVFRGFLQQQMAARFNSAFWWMIVPSVLFGFAHYNHEAEPVLRWTMVFATTVVGLIAADFTRITGSLAAAMGLHFANNFFALLVVGVPGELSGLALYHTSFTMDEADTLAGFLWIDIAVLIVVWVITRRIIR